MYYVHFASKCIVDNLQDLANILGCDPIGDARELGLTAEDFFWAHDSRPDIHCDACGCCGTPEIGFQPEYDACQERAAVLYDAADAQGMFCDSWAVANTILANEIAAMDDFKEGK